MFLVMAVPPVAAAQEVLPPETAPELVVTASRIGTGAEVTAIGREAIEHRQPLSLLDVLGDASGVRAFSTGGIGGRSFVSIEGGEPNFTLILLDGIKLNNPTNSRGGAFDFTQIDPWLVESVEIARGSLSAVHGSDALSGVVNIRLREPTRRGQHLAAHAGVDSYGAFSAGAAGELGWGSGGMLLSASRFDSGEETEGSDLRRSQAVARISQSAAGYGLKLTGLYTHTDRSAFPEDSGGPLFAVNRARETAQADLWTLGFTARRTDASAPLRPELSLSWSDSDETTRTPRIAKGVLAGVPALTSRDRFSRLEAIGALGFGGPSFRSVAGVALLHERGRSDGLIDFGFFKAPAAFDRARTTASAFAETSLRPTGALTLELAGRYDRFGGGRDRMTGRAGVRLEPRAGLPAIFARGGTAYKLPSFYSLGHPLVGNPGLRPERSTHLEAGAEWKRGSGRLRVAWFRNDFRDLIDFDPIAFRIVNRDRVRASGVEAEGAVPLTRDVSLTAAATHLTLASATPLRGRPEWYGAGGITWRAAPSVEIGAHVSFNGWYYDSSIPTGLVRSSGSAEADITALIAVRRGMRLDLAIRNITGTRAGEAVGFPRPGRRVAASFKVDVF